MTRVVLNGDLPRRPSSYEASDAADDLELVPLGKRPLLGLYPPPSPPQPGSKRRLLLRLAGRDFEFPPSRPRAGLMPLRAFISAAAAACAAAAAALATATCLVARAGCGPCNPFSRCALTALTATLTVS
mmetsp:Transcript_13265/g.26667  ORF Transcript_13265/g.26667 Transcript_13265/m.26667 type:complete len:129 (+) Transcript_13265:481-867(+)